MDDDDAQDSFGRDNRADHLMLEIVGAPGHFHLVYTSANFLGRELEFVGGEANERGGLC